jgi:class 3 adenylate cyclase
MSGHLDDIIAKKYGATNVMVVFLDVIKYSLRKSVMQQRVIKAFNVVLQQSCDAISREYATEAQKLDLNFAHDIIKIPTGDGAAIVFPVDGLQNIHLSLAVNLLSCVAARHDTECQIFAENGWCNCHDFFDVRIGIAEGKAIVFKDINDNYNVAGNPVNMASRVMGLADRQQILLTEEAYRNMIDMTEDTTLESKFTSHGTVPVKHDINIGIFQYIGKDEKFINKELPTSVSIFAQFDAVKRNPMFKGMPMPSNPNQMLQQAKKMAEVLGIISSTSTGEENPMSIFADMLTSDKPEDMDRFREFASLRQKLEELKKSMLKKE